MSGYQKFVEHDAHLYTIKIDSLDKPRLVNFQNLPLTQQYNQHFEMFIYVLEFVIFLKLWHDSWMCRAVPHT